MACVNLAEAQQYSMCQTLTKEMKTENNGAQEVHKNLFSSGMFTALDMMSQITLESLSSKKYEDLETIDSNSTISGAVNPEA